MAEFNHTIYLDHNATTPCDPRVVEVMLPYFSTSFGNAASRHHSFGWQAEEGVEFAREQVANLVGAEPNEIVFTSGATESVNLAIKGVFEMYASKGNHIITCNIEHKSVLDTVGQLEKIGAEVTKLSVNHDGLIDLAELESSIRPTTILIALMFANNETGTIMPIRAVGEIAKKHGILFFSDASQAVGKIAVDVISDHPDLMAFTAHKMYGPKGVGALYVRRKNPRVKLAAQIHGGGHEKGMRSGTLNVPGIVGFGKAAAICTEEMISEGTRLSRMRDKLEQCLTKLEETYVNGSRQFRLPHVTNLAFKYVDSEGLMMAIQKEIAVSSGSACTSASLEPSYVLKALGLSNDLAHGSIRFGLGRFTTEKEIDFTIDRIVKAVDELRNMSPVWEMFRKGMDVRMLR